MTSDDLDEIILRLAQSLVEEIGGETLIDVEQIAKGWRIEVTLPQEVVH